MKMLVLIGGLLFCGGRAWAQKTPAVGVESAVPFKGANAIVVHVPDSASVAYAKLTKGLLAAGYGLDKSIPGALYVSTPSKPIKDIFGLTLEVNAAPAPTGAAVVFRGHFTWASAAAIISHTDKRENEVRSMGGGSTPIQQMWLELQRVALECFPSASISYKKL